ncbi:MAG: glycosyltransferase family 39 protein, partial [Anaerolineae bacterium]|nr:glycosyltransferase family 39 protein [Anaerolineae bacterium]
MSLAFHPFFIPHIIMVNGLGNFLPLSNAFSLGFLLIIVLCAFSAYAYLVWLFNDKWVALFGAVVFGFSPHVVGHPNHPEIAFIATIPLALYCFHRGTIENRRVLVTLAGLLAGLTTVVTMYMFICLIIMLGLFISALAKSRWRDKGFWLNVTLLVVTVSLSSSWRIYPMLASSDSIGETVNWHGEEEIATDAISYFVNHSNPLFSRIVESNSRAFTGGQISETSYLGYLPLLLIAIGLLTTATRRKMVPWAGLGALFLILRLGSHLVVYGANFEEVLLPKYYLNQLLPEVFASFWAADHFMMGALLPLSVLSCYGLVALQKRFTSIAKPGVILALIAIVALEYHIPVQTDRIFPVGDGAISEQRFAFLEWLEQEDEEIRLINLPMGRWNSKVYNLYQSLSGFPHAEGAISRTPDSAFDYIRANLLLNTWHQQQPISCELVERERYFTGLSQLQADGFSHVVYHREFLHAELIKDSFREAKPSYADEFVWIFRVNYLRESCTEEKSANYEFTRAYANALARGSILDDRPGTVLVFPPTVRAADHFLRYLHHFADIDRSVVTITSDERAGIETRHSDINWAISSGDLEAHAALWLVNKPPEFEAEQTPAYQDWFKERFHFCQRFFEDEGTTIDA